jgi:GntR family transcriptional regulator
MIIYVLFPGKRHWALKPGDQLPGIRHLAETLVINPKTVAKAYRELEHEGIIEVRHGSGAFVKGANCSGKVQAAVPLVIGLVDKLKSRGLSDDEIRRLFESALMRQELPPHSGVTRELRSSDSQDHGPLAARSNRRKPR